MVYLAVVFLLSHGRVLCWTLFIFQYICFVFTEEDFADIAEGLAEHAARTMTIEPIPWLKNYTVKMEDLFTDLTVEKIQNKPTGPTGQVINDYKELFSKIHRSEKRRFRKVSRGNRILVTADPGVREKYILQENYLGLGQRAFHNILCSALYQVKICQIR